jgi:two-component system phosphate regulon sensor histidine kinase PhoR
VKIRHKLLLILVGAAVITSLLIGFAASHLLRTAVRERSIHWLEAQTELLAEWVVHEVTPDRFQAFAKESGGHLGVRVTLIAPDGAVVGDSAKSASELALMDDHRTRPEVRTAEASGVGRSVRRSASVGVTYLYTARKIPGSGPVRYARIALPFEDVQRVEARYAIEGALISLVALLLLTGIAYLFVRRISRPVERMSELAERTAGGAYHHPVPYHGDDEVGRLGASFDRMRRALVGKIEDLEHEQALLLSVMGGMREGLVLVDPDRRIRLANEAFRQVFGLPEDPSGRLLAEAIRNPTVIRDLDRALEEGIGVRDLVIRAPDSGRSFELHVTPLQPREADEPAGALVLFFDITRLEALESVRRDFVANVSHELRTPLTSIKAFVETLLSGGLEDREHAREFLGIAGKHADRMEDLIDDLTDLSLIETDAVELELETVAVEELCREVLVQLESKHGEAASEVLVEVPPGFTLRADRRRLEQVLMNLVDNAIKFSRPEGTVRITTCKNQGRGCLKVEDTGMGIPSESHEKIFHRFYRVDKARSREMGGTGLGLSIVKHLMRLHGGAVSVESEVGRGSTFTLEFPPEGNGEAAEADPA